MLQETVITGHRHRFSFPSFFFLALDTRFRTQSASLVRDHELSQSRSNQSVRSYLRELGKTTDYGAINIIVYQFTGAAIYFLFP